MRGITIPKKQSREFKDGDTDGIFTQFFEPDGNAAFCTCTGTMASGTELRWLDNDWNATTRLPFSQFSSFLSRYLLSFVL